MENMGKLSQKLKTEIEFFVKKIEYIIPVLLTAILSFGFVVTHYSINWDTLAGDRYFEGTELLAQNRYGAVLLNKIFGVWEFNPFFVDCLAVIFLIASAICFCMLFKRISNGKINMVSYTIFSCIFISYPLINEIFTASPASLSICLLFFIISISMHLLYDGVKQNKIKNFVYVSIIMTIFLSVYESSAVVYLCCAFVMEILDFLYNNKEKKIQDVVIEMAEIIIPLAISVIFTGIIANTIRAIFGIEASQGVAVKQILYKELGLIKGLENLITSTFYQYVLNALFYLPITVLQISIILMIILGIVYGKKSKSVTIFLLFIGCIISIFALPIIQGGASYYRTCQSFQIFSAVAFMLFIQYILENHKGKILKNICVFLAFLIVLYQAKDLNKIFFINNLRYEQERTTLISVAERLENEYSIKTKPVIFIRNGYKPYDYVLNEVSTKTNDWRARLANAITSKLNPENKEYSEKNKYIDKPIESTILPYLNWGVAAFSEVNTEIFKWLRFLGYDDIKSGTGKMYLDAIEKQQNGVFDDAKGEIIEQDEYIVVLVDRRV